MKRLRVAALVLLTELAVPALAAADAPRVLLVRPPAAAREVSAALVRVQGELVADGFEVVSIEAPPGTTSAMAMDQAEAQPTSTTVGLFLSGDGRNAELWVVDRLTNKTVVRHVATSGESENLLPEVLALKAVELLRASLLELVVERNSAAATVSRAATEHASAWAARPLASTPRWAVETGVCALWSPGQIAPAFESVARARFAPLQAVQVRVSLAGLGTRPQVNGTGGSAQIEQFFGLAEGVLVPFPRLALRPTMSLGAGAFQTTANGDGSFPYRGVSTSQWAFAVDAGVGILARLASRLELSVEGHALWAAPEPIVRFVSDDGAEVGHPALVGSLTLLGWL